MAIPLRKVIDYKFYDNITYNEIPYYEPLLSITLYNKFIKKFTVNPIKPFFKQFYCKEILIISLNDFIFQII